MTRHLSKPGEAAGQADAKPAPARPRKFARVRQTESEMLFENNLDMGSIGRMINSCSKLLRHSSISIRQQQNVAHHFIRAVHEKVLNLNNNLPNENDCVYLQVHKRLDQITNTDNVSLSINSEIANLQDLLSHSSVDQIKLQESFSSLSSHIKVLNQRELATVLTKIKNINSPEFRKLKLMIDFEFRWLFKNNVGTALMDLDLYFYVADIFYECMISSRFVTALLQHLGKSKHNVTLTDEQLLHLLFLAIVKRQHCDILETYEQRINQLLDKASFHHVAIICLAYFKTSTRIKNSEVFKKIVLRTISSLDSINFEQPGYCAVIKALRYSSKSVEKGEDFSRYYANELMSTITSDQRYKSILFASNFNMCQTLKLMEEFKIYRQEVLDDCRHHLFNNLDQYRFKDMQYCITSLSNLSYNNLHMDPSLENDFKKLSDMIIALQRKDFTLHGHHLFALLRAFAIFGYYNEELILYASSLLGSARQAENMKKFLIEFDKTALLLHIAPQIEGCKFKLTSPLLTEMNNNMKREINRPGPFTNSSSIRSLDDMLLRKHPHRSDQFIGRKYRKVAIDLLNSKQFKGGLYRLAFQYTMPHLNYADLVVSKGCREPGGFDEKTLMPRQVPANEKHCVVYAVRAADYCDPRLTKLCGYKRFSIRLLERLGYKVVTVDLANPSIEELASNIKSSLDG